jgi:hypothetical protein
LNPRPYPTGTAQLHLDSMDDISDRFLHVLSELEEIASGVTPEEASRSLEEPHPAVVLASVARDQLVGRLSLEIAQRGHHRPSRACIR